MFDSCRAHCSPPFLRRRSNSREGAAGDRPLTGTLAGILVYVAAGGIVLFLTWLAAAAVALPRRAPASATVAPTPP